MSEARRLRAEAAGLTEGDARDELLRLAARYEVLARQAERREAGLYAANDSSDEAARKEA